MEAMRKKPYMSQQEPGLFKPKGLSGQKWIMEGRLNGLKQRKERTESFHHQMSCPPEDERFWG